MTGTGNPESIQIKDFNEVTSNFKSISDLLKVEIEGDGAVDIDQEAFEDNPSRRNVTIHPIPQDGWRFTGWKGDVKDDNEMLYLTIGKELSLIAEFEKVFYLHENGVTIMCPQSQVGEKGIVDGIEYEAVDRELLNERIAEEADLTKVCVSLVTDMYELFYGTDFNQAIGHWDVSNVTNMSEMFSSTNFNHTVARRDVSKVKYMAGMFSGTPFDQPIGDWDVSQVTDMGCMFCGSRFNQPIGDWEVKKINNMTGMFGYSDFNQPINEWCVPNIYSEPDDFSMGSPLEEKNKPKWGTCP